VGHDILGHAMNRRPRVELFASSGPRASPEECAAVMAAVEQFMRDSAPPRVAPAARDNPWLRAARLEEAGHVVTSAPLWGAG